MGIIGAGLSDDILVSVPGDECISVLGDECTSNCLPDHMQSDSTTGIYPDSKALADEGNVPEYAILDSEPMVDGNMAELCGLKLFEGVSDPLNIQVPSRVDAQEEEELGNVDFSNLFCEDPSVSTALPPEVLKMQKKERMVQSVNGQVLEKTHEIWRKVICF